MSYSVYINGVDKSNYVVDIDPIPIFNSNLTKEPVCDGVTIKLVYNYAGVINEGDEVEIKWGNTPIWLGYVYKRAIEGYSLYRVLEVKHFVLKLADYSVRSPFLEAAIRDVATWTGAKTFGPSDVNVSTNRITVTSHGFATNDIVTVKSSGVLPGGLNTNYQYEVTVIDANTIELEYPITGAPGAGIVVLTSGGSGTHYITKNIDFNKFVEWDNVYMPNVSIDWLLKAMFNMIGLTLTVESPQFTFGERILNAKNMALDLNMMKVLGYPTATSTPTDDDSETIISCFNLFQRLCQIFGWSLVYYGVLGTKNYALLRRASYSSFGFNNYVVEKYERQDVFNSPDQVYGSEYFAQVVGGTSRDAYRSSTKTPLTEHNRVTALLGNYLYPYPSNLKILVRQATSPTYHISYNGGSEEYIPISSMVQSYYDTYENDYTLYEYEMKPISFVDIINHPVKEVHLNIKTNRMRVLQ